MANAKIGGMDVVVNFISNILSGKVDKTGIKAVTDQYSQFSEKVTAIGKTNKRVAENISQSWEIPSAKIKSNLRSVAGTLKKYGIEIEATKGDVVTLGKVQVDTSRKAGVLAKQMQRGAILAGKDTNKLVAIIQKHNKSLKDSSNLQKVHTRTLQARANIEKKVENLQRRATQNMYRNRLEIDRMSNALRRLGTVGLIAYAGLIRQSVTFAIELTRLRAVTGADVKEIARLSAVAQGFGVDAKTFIKSVGGLSQALLTAGEGTSLVAKRVREVLREAGLEAERFKGKHMPVLKVLELSRKAYQGLVSPIDKAYLAQRYFGENAEAMMPFLEASDKSIKDLTESIGMLPGITQRSTERMVEFNLKLQTMAAVAKATGFTVAESLIPLFDKILSGAKQISYFVKGIEDSVGIISQAGIVLSGFAITLGFLIPVATTLSRTFTLMGVHASGALASFSTLGTFMKGVLAWFVSPVGLIIAALAGLATAIVYFKVQSIKARGEMKVAGESAETLADRIASIRVTDENRDVIEYLKSIQGELSKLASGDYDMDWSAWETMMGEKVPREALKRLGEVYDDMEERGEKASTAWQVVWAGMRRVPTKEIDAVLKGFEKDITAFEKNINSLSESDKERLESLYKSYKTYLLHVYRGESASARYATFRANIHKEIAESLFNEERLSGKVLLRYDEWIKKEEELAQKNESNLDEQYKRRRKQLDVNNQIFVLEGRIEKAVKEKNFALADSYKSYKLILENEREVIMAKDEIASEEKKLNKLSNDRLKIIKAVDKWTEEISRKSYNILPAYKDAISLLEDARKQVEKLVRAGDIQSKKEKLWAVVRQKLAKVIGEVETDEQKKTFDQRIKYLEAIPARAYQLNVELEGLYRKRADTEIKEWKRSEAALLDKAKVELQTITGLTADEVEKSKEFATIRILVAKTMSREILAVETELKDDLEKIWSGLGNESAMAWKKATDDILKYRKEVADFAEKNWAQERVLAKTALSEIIRRMEVLMEKYKKGEKSQTELHAGVGEILSEVSEEGQKRAGELGLSWENVAKRIPIEFKRKVPPAIISEVKKAIEEAKKLKWSFNLEIRRKIIDESEGIESKAKGGYLTPQKQWKPLNLVPSLADGGMLVRVHPNEVISPLEKLPEVARKMGITENRTLNMNINNSWDVQELYRQIKRFMAIDSYQKKGLAGLA